jgi:hypothetical protein
VRQGKRAKQPTVRFRNFWGSTKRDDLLASLGKKGFNQQYETPEPHQKNRCSFRPLHVSPEYFSWPSIISLCSEEPISGLQEMRHSAFLDIDRDKLEKRMRVYFDPNVDWATVKALNSGLSQKAGGFSPQDAREKALTNESFTLVNLRRYALYPFDVRWCYYTKSPTLWNRPRPELVSQCWLGNRFFISRMFAERPHEQLAVSITPELPDYHLLRPNAVAIPLRLRQVTKLRPKCDDENGEFSSILQETTLTAGSGAAEVTANLSPDMRNYLSRLAINTSDAGADTAEIVWMHALAISHAPGYLAENADGIRQDFPRIPLPATQDALLASAALGKNIAALLDSETAVLEIDDGKIRDDLKHIAVLSSPKGHTINLAVNAGWGHTGNDGVTMPGKGRAESRAFTTHESTALGGHITLLGPTGTVDIFLNADTCWRNVPERVWHFTIGGYQVLKKWLSYRERELLGRAITVDEVRTFTHTARRIAALICLEPALNENYNSVKNHTANFQI